MRYNFHVENVIKKYVDKRPKVKEYILLKSAITQIVFLTLKIMLLLTQLLRLLKN